MRRTPLFVCSAAVMAMLSPSEARAGEPEDERIYGGQISEPCAWPTTVTLDSCTGTLVHPEVVIYAAHCGAGYNQVKFGETANSPAKTVATRYCRTNPAYGGAGPGTDQAFCVLAQPVTDVPIVPIAMGCETSVLNPGTEVAIVGFGEADSAPTYGVKREAMTFIGLNNGAEVFIGGGGVTSCFGDSGGPAYVRLSSEIGGDDTWRVFGIVSYGTSQQCGAGAYYSMMHTGMAWFEGQLAADGIDITPCHDTDGTWNPTPQCQGFPMNPGASSGSWSSGCQINEPIGGASAMCGAPFNEEPDPDPPTAVITSPADETIFDTMGNPDTPVMVTVDAQDVGYGIRDVKLLVNGAEIVGGTDNFAPYEWVLNMPPGAYTIGAVARDWGDNETEADAVRIGVDMDPPPPPEPGETSEDGGTGDDAGEVGTGEEGETGGLDDPKGCACAAGDGDPTEGAGALALFGLMAWRRRR
jgi:MYXO-CTERM domain-containing protein